MTRPMSSRTVAIILLLTLAGFITAGLYGVHTQEGSFSWEVSE